MSEQIRRNTSQIRVERKRKRRNRRIVSISLAAVLIIGIGFFALRPKEAEGGDSAAGNGAGNGMGAGQTPDSPSEPPETNRATEENPYGAFYFYEADKLQRYKEYHAANLALTEEEVVWQVNAHLDKPFYEEPILVDDVKAKPLVVNKYYCLPEDFEPENLVSLPSGRQATAETKAAYEELRQDAKKEGLTISEGSAYRAINYQVEVYARYMKKDPQEVVDTYSSRPGHSDHHTGEALDLLARDGTLTNFGNDPESGWVAENAHLYGFIIRYPQGLDHITGYTYEPWHIRYVGKEIATFMKENNITTLEEYKVKYIDHKPE